MLSPLAGLRIIERQPHLRFDRCAAIKTGWFKFHYESAALTCSQIANVEFVRAGGLILQLSVNFVDLPATDQYLDNDILSGGLEQAMQLIHEGSRDLFRILDIGVTP